MKQQSRGAFWSHVAVLVVVYASPFFFHWKLIAAGILVYYVQLLIWGNCVLTAWQFGAESSERSFNGYYLRKAGIRISPAAMEFVSNLVIPAGLISVALVWQVAWKHPTIF